VSSLLRDWLGSDSRVGHLFSFCCPLVNTPQLNTSTSEFSYDWIIELSWNELNSRMTAPLRMSRSLSLILRPMVSRPVYLGINHPSRAYDQIFITVRQLRVCWCGAGPRQRSHSRVRVPWDMWSYFTLSDSRLPFSSPPTTRRATVDVFDPASTRGLANESESESYVTTDGQSASLSWNKAPIWSLRSDFYYCPTVADLLMCSALSDERTGLSFTVAAGPRQRSHTQIRRDFSTYGQ
jgi:hypothetical protein